MPLLSVSAWKSLLQGKSRSECDDSSKAIGPPSPPEAPPQCIECNDAAKRCASPRGNQQRQNLAETSSSRACSGDSAAGNANSSSVSMALDDQSEEAGAAVPAQDEDDDGLLFFTKEEWEQSAEVQLRAVRHVCRIMDHLVQQTSLNRPAPAKVPKKLEVFEGKHLPCTATHFITGMLRYGDMSPCCVVVAYLYLTRIRRAHPELVVTSTNCQRLLLTAVMVATKFCEDENFNNKYWGEVGELHVREVNALEIRFLNLLNMTCMVRRSEYDRVLVSLSETERSVRRH